MASDQNTWREWIQAELSNGISPDTLLKTAKLHGALSEERSNQFWYEVSLWQKRKIKSLAALSRLSRMHLGPIKSIDVLSNYTAEEFVEHYLKKSKPVVLKNFAATWPCTQKWSLQYLCQTVGKAQVAINTQRTKLRGQDREYLQKIVSLSMQTYIDRIESESPTNDFYLVAHAEAWKQTEFSTLYDDVPLDAHWFDVTIPKRDALSFWLGPQGTWTPLHCDPVNNLLTLIRGTKRFKLIDPYQIELMNTAEGYYNLLRADDLKTHPNKIFRQIPVFEIKVDAPDALFIPTGWWHEVESLDISLHLSMTATHDAHIYKDYSP